MLLPPDTLRKAGQKGIFAQKIICEMRYSRSEYEIDGEEQKKLERRIEVFRDETKTKKSIILTLVTSEGLKRNAHSDIIQSLIVEDELFNI